MDWLQEERKRFEDQYNQEGEEENSLKKIWKKTYYMCNEAGNKLEATIKGALIRSIESSKLKEFAEVSDGWNLRIKVDRNILMDTDFSQLVKIWECVLIKDTEFELFKRLYIKYEVEKLGSSLIDI